MADLFELVGRFAIEGADKAKKEIDDVTDAGENSSSKLSKLSGIATAVGKSVLAVGTAVTAGSVALVKGVSSSYGELQQNLGGSEAVFGQYASNIQKIGETAYKNMGISQSEFLATANKMGSLLQGSGIDQRTALDMTAQAMQRASDVASVMGIDMTMAMESITGACKGNFTMMDNLGVAMNATNLEAYALEKGLTNFSWKTATQAEKNTLAMQMFLERTQQYAGNFARESTDTITGAIGYLGAAWQDFMAGLGNPEADMARLTNNLAQSFGAMITNMTPIIENLTKALPSVLDALIKSVGQMLPTLISTFGQLVVTVVTNLSNLLTQYVPLLFTKGKEFLDGLGEGIRENIPNVISKGLEMLQSFADFLAENAPLIIQSGMQLLRNLIQGIMDSLPELIANIPTIISTFANIINDNAPTIIMTGVGIIFDIIKGLIQAIPTLIANIPQIIMAILDVWSAFNWIDLGKNVIKLIGNGFEFMLGFAKNAINTVKNGIINTISNLPSNLGNLARKAITNMGNIISGLRGFISTSARNIFNSVINVFKNLPSKVKSIGSNLVKGLFNGISDMTGWIMNKIGGFADSVVKKIKGVFGIHSPSRVMRDEVGNYLVQGIGVGIDEDDSAEKAIKNKVDSILDFATGSMSDVKLNPNIDNFIGESPLQKYQLDFNAQLDLLNDGFDRLIALIGQYLPEIAENSAKEFTLNKNELVLGISKNMDKQLGKMSLAKGRGNV